MGGGHRGGSPNLPASRPESSSSDATPAGLLSRPRASPVKGVGAPPVKGVVPSNPLALSKSASINSANSENAKVLLRKQGITIEGEESAVGRGAKKLMRDDAQRNAEVLGKVGTG